MFSLVFQGLRPDPSSSTRSPRDPLSSETGSPDHVGTLRIDDFGRGVFRVVPRIRGGVGDWFRDRQVLVVGRTWVWW